MAEEKKKEELNYQFVSLVFSLQQAAMAQLGKIANPATGKMEKNLVQAKATIDMLEMLKEKSEGNLTDTEQKIILNTLDNLYLNYADEVEKPAVAEAQKETAESARRNGESEKRGNGDTKKEKTTEGTEEKKPKEEKKE
ncbi:DUF1844 domain-containing protein [bacterium]|nr:DUF1844 domain-containing protein [bacterium]